MMIICAKLFLIPTLQNKVMGRTRVGFLEVCAQSLRANFDLDLWPATWFLFATHRLVMMIISAKLFFKSHYVWLSYGPDTILEHTHTHTHTHTRTYRLGNLYMPFHHFMAGHNKKKRNLTNKNFSCHFLVFEKSDIIKVAIITNLGQRQKSA